MGYAVGYVYIPSVTKVVGHMENERYVPTKAEFLADLIQGSATYQSTMASVQRSHRFPLHIFVQIENMARMGDVPVSLIINQLLECGLESVYNELPEERARELGRLSKEQLERKTVTETVEVKNVRVAKTKVQRSK
ncbi:hypothetical protein [Dechloromonas agitata]|uniref:hypothetical protein n=1 Tax=Dechloromonas agitata TaxID=73030 RepID=UPI0009FE7F5B|nr:hypothetical protein [Dechloromonas agitata]